MSTALAEREAMRIGLLAPPWLSVPPPAYGGTESVVDRLSRGLVAAGHDVRLWTTADSTCPVPRGSVFTEARTDVMGTGVVELQHDIEGYAWLAGEGCDLVHDHTMIGPFVRTAGVPVITTNHGPFDTPEATAIYRRIADEHPIIAISHHQASVAAQLGIRVAHVIHHGIDVASIPPGEGRGDERGPYLLFLGRVNPTKGIVEAIDAARAAGMRLLIAAKMREPLEIAYFHDVIAPRCGGDVVFLGEVYGADKYRLLGGATALLNPIQWPEPFGLVMIEALAAGTPVIATGRGSCPEIVRHGHNGFVCDDHDSLVRAVRAADRIDRRECRADVARRFAVDTMVDRHVAAYRDLLHARSGAATGPRVAMRRP
jgi:glycosyltransferase involved in cell wall biosynthesis